MISAPLVVGYGNPLRGDDGLGWEIVRSLAEKHGEDYAHFIAAHQLAPEIAEHVAAAGLVIFVDAAAHEPPGSITCRKVSANADDTRPATHHMTPEAVLTMARVLYGKEPETWLYTINGMCFDVGASLSGVVSPKVEEVSWLIASQIDDYVKTMERTTAHA
ncbi:MAG: hydrogenase maturation protease [Candidatus Sumerlaeaceae bacterium]|nr:hydrogenase maturation protease [Candidatus Sumerlaeaceae bacterium]